MNILYIINEKIVDIHDLKNFTINNLTVNEIVKKTSRKNEDSDFSPTSQVANV